MNAIPPKLQDLERADAERRNKKVLLIIGIVALAFLALIAAVFCLRIFHLANVVNGNG
jgi:hypothetical protein